MLRRAVPFEYHGVFPRPETTAPTNTPEVILWVACFLCAGLLRSWGAPLPKKGIFDENGEIDENPNMLVFTESGHQIDENDENDEIDENTLRLAGRGAPPHWCKLELSAQNLAEVRDASAYCFFSNASASSALEWGGSLRWPEGEASGQS